MGVRINKSAIIPGKHPRCQREDGLVGAALWGWRLISLSIEGLWLGLIEEDNGGLRQPPG